MTVKKRGRWVSIYLPELKGFVLLQTRSVWQNIPKNTLSSFFCWMNFQSTTLFTKLSDNKYIVRKKHFPQWLQPSFFTRFFSDAFSTGKKHIIFFAWKTSGKNQVILPEYFRFPGYLSSGSQSFKQVAKRFVFFLPWKVCRQERSGGSDF